MKVTPLQSLISLEANSSAQGPICLGHPGVPRPSIVYGREHEQVGLCSPCDEDEQNIMLPALFSEYTGATGAPCQLHPPKLDNLE